MSEIKKIINFSCGIDYPLLKTDEDFLSAVNTELSSAEYSSSKRCKVYAKWLKEMTKLDAVFSSSVEQAVSVSINFARNYSQKKYSKQRNEILFIDEGFYKRFLSKCLGSSLGLSHANSNHVGSFISALSDKTCAVFIEPISLDNYSSIDKNFFRQIADVCEARDILLGVFETCTYPYRVGKLFSFMQYGILPDIAVVNSGLANGLSLSAVLYGAKVEKGKLSISPVSEYVFSGALAVAEKVDGFMDAYKKNAKMLSTAIKMCKKVKEFTGTGVNYLLKVQDAEKEIQKFKELGIKVSGGKGKIYLAPPLSLSQEDFAFCVKTIKDVLDGNPQNPFDV